MDTAEDPTVQPEVAPPNDDPIVDGPSQEESQPQNERELSQTDHLNKSLLTSFLARLNDPNCAYPMTAGQGFQQDQTGGESDTAHHDKETTGGKMDEDASSPWLQNDWNDTNDEAVEMTEK